jgi:hypothetical protein
VSGNSGVTVVGALERLDNTDQTMQQSLAYITIKAIATE